jgi:protein SCO1/2
MTRHIWLVAAARAVGLRAVIFAGLLLPLTHCRAQEPASLGERFGDVGIDQHLDTQLPLEETFCDESGRVVRLGQYFGSRPVIVNLVYYECPLLCNVALNGLLQGMEGLPFDAGDKYEVVTISFNPNDTPALAAAKKKTYLRRYSRPSGAEGWHFLTGKTDAIQRVAQAIGFRYFYDEKSALYVHAAGLVVATPDGRLARYLFGVDYAPQDLRLALVEASAGHIGTVADQFLLLCYHYDPATGKYGLAILNVMRAAGVLTVVGLIAGVLGLLHRERRGLRALAAATSAGQSAVTSRSLGEVP